MNTKLMLTFSLTDYFSAQGSKKYPGLIAQSKHALGQMKMEGWWSGGQVTLVLPPFSLICDFQKTKHWQKHLKNFHRSYMLSTDRIELCH